MYRGLQASPPHESTHSTRSGADRYRDFFLPRFVTPYPGFGTCSRTVVCGGRTQRRPRFPRCHGALRGGRRNPTRGHPSDVPRTSGRRRRGLVRGDAGHSQLSYLHRGKRCGRRRRATPLTRLGGCGVRGLAEGSVDHQGALWLPDSRLRCSRAAARAASDLRSPPSGDTTRLKPHPTARCRAS